MSDIESPPEPAVKALNDLGHVGSAIGHHVINAFAAVVSNAEILRLKLATANPADPAVLAEMIINTAIEASTVARRLIDYTRPITNVGDDHLELDRFVADYVEARRALETDGLRWETDLAPVPPIRGHAGHLRSMLDHLTDNAIEAKVNGQTSVTMATSVDARGWVVLEVRDTGRGMEPGVMERAVEPFYSTKPGHVGVGLCIANGIWRRHKGTLALRSQPDEGTALRLCVEPIGHV